MNVSPMDGATSKRGPARLERLDWLILAGLLGAVAAFLFPYLALGRSMLPLELLAVFQPWASHPEAFAKSVPLAHNPLLDTLQQYYPRRVYMTDALHEGWLPLWNPYVYGGSPFLAAQQGAVLYPPAWLLAFFPPALQFGWSALLHLYAAAAGMYLFLRAVGLDRAPSCLGAVAFALNGFIVVWLAYPNVTQWTLCWLPLALYAWERGFQSRDPRWAAGSGAVLALSLLGGHGQSSAYLLLVWGVWCATRTLTASETLPARLGFTARWVGLPFALGVLLSLGHLLPVLDFVPRTDRGGRVPWESVVHAGMPPAQFWTLLLPRLFGDGTLDFGQQSWLPTGGRAGFSFVERSFYPGVSVLLLAVPAALFWRPAPVGAQGNFTPRLLARVALVLTVLSFLWAAATPLYWPLWQLLPGFGQFTAVGRIVCIAGWGLPCLAALGLQVLRAPDAEVRRRGFRAVLVGAGVMAALLLVAHFIYGGADPAGIGPFLAQSGRDGLDALAQRDLILPLVWLAGIVFIAFHLRLRRTSVLAATATVVVGADLFGFGFGFNPRSDPALLKADTPELQALRERPEPERFLSPRPADTTRDLKERMPSNLASMYGAADLLGSDSFVPLRYREWEQATQTASGGATSAAWARGPNARSAAVSLYLAGERQSLTGLHPVAGVLKEDLRALPYARHHANVQALRSRQELLEALSHPRRVNLVALTQGPGAVTFDGPARIQPFTARRINGNRLSIEGVAPVPGLLVIAEAYDPGWRVRVNGRPARAIAADHLLTGVVVEAGTQKVDLIFAPAVFRVGLFGSLLGLACLTGILVVGRRRTRRTG